jgi:hypothetical protein
MRLRLSLPLPGIRRLRSPPSGQSPQFGTARTGTARMAMVAVSWPMRGPQAPRIGTGFSSPRSRAVRKRASVGIDHAAVLPRHCHGRQAFRRPGYRGPDHKAAACVSFARKIDRQRRFVGKHQASLDGPPASLVVRGHAGLPIACERLEIDRVFVTECRMRLGGFMPVAAAMLSREVPE